MPASRSWRLRESPPRRSSDSLQALAHDEEQIADERQALQTARTSLQLSRTSYHAGAIGLLQLLDAERQANQAQLGLARATAQRYQDTTQLFAALGGATRSQADSPTAICRE